MARNITLIQLPMSVLNALADGDIVAANLGSSIELRPYFVGPECRGTWQRRASQVAEDPNTAVWITRAILDVDRCVVVGRAGFHGAPDESGLVEVGYAIDPAFRRRGYARAALVELLKWANSDESTQTIRATIRPDNLASRALVQQYGFVEVGHQMDSKDGLEIVYEVAARSASFNNSGRFPTSSQI